MWCDEISPKDTAHGWCNICKKTCFWPELEVPARNLTAALWSSWFKTEQCRVETCTLGKEDYSWASSSVHGQMKVVLDIKKGSLSIACSGDWLALLYVLLRRFDSQLSAVNSCGSAASAAERVNMRCMLLVLNLVSRLGLQLDMPSICWLQISDDSLHSEQSSVL